MLAPLKWVGKEYQTLIAKMLAKSGSMEATKGNHLVNLCDVNTMLGLPCVLPILEHVNTLMKFAQVRDVFMGNYIVIIKI
jgi:hypothetical protein